MSSSAVSPDFICSLIFNLLNLLVNVLLLWQSQKLFVIMVCFAGSRNLENLVISGPLIVLQKQRDTDPEAMMAHLCTMKEKSQTKENPKRYICVDVEKRNSLETDTELTENLESAGKKEMDSHELDLKMF
jgi:hypothetical protein